MSYNNNFYNATFHNAFVPSHSPRPMFNQTNTQTDENVIKYFESKIALDKKTKLKPQITISDVRNQVFDLLNNLNNMKAKEKELLAKVNDLTDEEWTNNLQEIEENKNKINDVLGKINNLNFDVLGKLLAKRLAKRARLKRVRLERKREKEEWIKEMKEKSRKIDENLQKIKDDINKAKQEEEAKLQADIVLKETLRKKHDAKKCIVKLDALIKLRKARHNTAKGRGESVSDNEMIVFESNIGKLKSLWIQKLALYEKEELELRAKLSQESLDSANLKQQQNDIESNLIQWKELMFGGSLPQVDFNGDVDKFISVRCQWDQFIHTDGTAIPIGWIPPTIKAIDSN